MPKLNEDTLTEQPVIGWLKELGYEYVFGPEIAPGGMFQERESFREVILFKRLGRSLRRLNPELDETAISNAIRELTSVVHPNLEISNKEIYRMLVEGVRVEVKEESEERRGKIVKVFDFDNPLDNEFLVVNQFSVEGAESVRRPDVVVFINGIPVAIFEFKNPTREEATIHDAYHQLQDYKKEIPELFKYNQVLAISDLLEAQHGTISASPEWFLPWRRIEKEVERLKGVSKLEVLTKGIFHKARFLDIIQNFIVFEADSEKDASKYTKKMALYHQYYGVNTAVDETLRAAGPSGNKKIGVFWHTQGSGKSLSMVFYVNKVGKLAQLKSPTFVFLTDRNDLDSQLYKTFLRTGYSVLAKQAESINGLKDKLRNAGFEILFTTIQKFDGEEFDLLSKRENIIVVADEAHRSQYAKLAGNVRKAIPNASFMGITGTPISLKDRDTRLVFGDLVSTYPIDRAVEDGATVPIYYEGRLVPLHLTNEFIDEEFEDLTEEVHYELKEDLKRKWARLEQAVGSADRLDQISKDIVEHFNNRGLEGKAMVVTMSRRIAVEMYERISNIKGSPELAVVVSKTEDFEGRIQKEVRPSEIERRFKDPNDPLKMVIVCDMWLTGFDVPPLHTMYFDKPIKDHTLMQAIARVNRVFKDKPGGLVVDYIGIADDLKKALGVYSSNVRKQAMIPIKELINKMLEKYDVVKSMLTGVGYANWKRLEPTELAQLLQQAINVAITDTGTGLIDNEKKERFIKESILLVKLFALAMPHHEAVRIRHEVEFFQAVKKAITKATIIVEPPEPGDIEIESAIKELISKSIAAEGIVDIFAMKEKGKPEMSILDEKFLEEVKKSRYKNVAIEVLKKLLRDELKLRQKANTIRYKSLAELLDKIIEEYENRVIKASEVIGRLIELAREIKNTESAGKKLDLTEEELAFYDAIASGKRALISNGELKNLVKELVKVIKRDLSVDWSDNEIVKSRIRANVKLLLIRNGFSHEESVGLLDTIYQQALALFSNYVPDHSAHFA